MPRCPRYPPLEMSGQGNAVNSEGEEGEDIAGLTTQLALLGISPNPFNPTVVLTFTVPAESKSVSLTIHGVDGRLVCRLLAIQLNEGEHSIAWRGRDDEGRRLPSGVYFARLHAGGDITMRKMLLVQ